MATPGVRLGAFLALALVLSVSARAQTFSNTGAITIPTGGSASPYPSSIAVSGITSTVTDVNVTLNGLSHTWPNDVDILLVGPGGQKIYLMSDAGGSTAVSGLTLTFDDEAAGLLPDESVITSGSYRPTNHEGDDTFPSPAPLGPYGTSLTAFDAVSPNGTWSLYVRDEFTPDGGSISGGWSITFTVAASGPTFSNTGSISIPTGPGAATPYPSNITVSGITGSVTDVNVTLTGLSHTYPDDIDAIVVGPGGQKIYLMSDAGGSTAVSGRTLTFDDEASGPIPDAGPMPSGSYDPSNYEGTDAMPTGAPLGPYGTSLTAFDGVAANGTWSLYVADDVTGDGGSISGGWTLSFTVAAPTPIFSIAPSGTVSFGTAGACSTTASTSQVFTVTNSGSGTLVVSGASMAGGSSAAYSITSAPSFPVNLTAGQSTTLTVTFAPSVGMTGTQTGTLQVNYNAGSAQTATVSLTGTASNANLASGSGAGYGFRNSLAACTVGSPLPAPGTALVPFTGHTRITTWTSGTADDGYFTVPASALDAMAGGSFRYFGKTYEGLFITTNGIVTFGSGVTDTNVPLPTSTGGGLIAVASTDLDFSSTYAGDNTGVGGAPGVFYGTADVDADGDQEFVVTWWHAYDYNSLLVYPNAGARFFTAQLVLHDAGDQPNREDRVEMRFLDGNDANGVPFRRNTNAAAFLEPDGATGLSNPEGTAAAEYREDAVGGSYYGSSLGVRFQAEVQATADEALPGWRMMGAPVSAFTVGRLGDLNLVQSVAGQYPSYPHDNVYLDYNGSAFVPAANVTDAVTPGQGFIWYLFNQNITPDPGNHGGGTSQSYALPMELEGTGAEVTGTSYPIPLHTAGDKWNLIANPFRQSLNVSGLSGWASGGALASGVGEIWKPTSTSAPYGTYVLTTDPEVNNVVTAWQGLFVQNNTATSLAVPAAAKTTGGSFVGRGGVPLAEDVRLVGFELAQGGEGGPLLDRAAILYFHPEAGIGWDAFDVSKLAPLSDVYATIGFTPDPSRVSAKAQESRPFDGGVYDLPMQLDAVGMSGTFTLSWPRFVNVPEGWALTLRDLVTGAEVDLRHASSYTFEAGETAPRASGERGGARRQAPRFGEIARAAQSRFVLHVEGDAVAPGATSESLEDLPAAFALRDASPNPFTEATTVWYDVPEAARVSVEVYDLLGRRVATLVDGAVEAGYHGAVLEGRALASGVYVVRMQSDTGFAAAQRLTLVR